MDYESLQELISIKTAAQHSGFSERHVRLLLEKGLIKGVKVGHDWVTTRHFVDEYALQEHKRGRKAVPPPPIPPLP